MCRVFGGSFEKVVRSRRYDLRLVCTYPEKYKPAAFRSSKAQGHRGATACRLRDRHASAVYGGDLARQREAYAASLPLGREEGHENFFPLLGRDAGTVIRYLHQDVSLRVTERRKPNRTLGRVA